MTAPEYITARRVLLDALSALQGHINHLILVGAQAVYHHTGETELNVALSTTDADVAIDTEKLPQSPEISQLLRDVGFLPGANPGSWLSADAVAVDLMVAPHQSGTTKIGARAARIPPHHISTARITRGLEPALIDNQLVVIRALDGPDNRSFKMRVAGPAALITAKVIKISERREQARRNLDRLREKDSLDLFRLLQAIETPQLVAGFNSHLADPYACKISTDALNILWELASSVDGPIIQYASAAANHNHVVAPSFVVLVKQLQYELSGHITRNPDL